MSKTYRRIKSTISAVIITVFQVLSLFTPVTGNVYAAETVAVLDTGVNINSKLKSLTEDVNDIEYISYIHMDELDEDISTIPGKVEIDISSVPVYAWKEDIYVYICSSADRIELNADSSYLFSGFTGLVGQSLLSPVTDAGSVTDMSHMFDGDTSLTEVSMSSLTLPSSFTGDKLNGILNDCTALKYFTSPLKSGTDITAGILPADMREDTDSDLTDLSTDSTVLTGTVTIGEDPHTYINGIKINISVNGSTDTIPARYVVPGRGKVNFSIISPAAESNTETGYIFTGKWYKTDDYREEWSEWQNVESETTIYGRYVSKDYTVKYDSNGAYDGVDMEDSTFTFLPGENPAVSGNTCPKLSPCTFARTGYSFSGWSETASGDVKYSNMESVNFDFPNPESAEKTLYAVWRKNTFTLNFNGNGADNGEMEPLPMEYDQDYTLPENTFSREGYDFGGWALSAEATEAGYEDKDTVRNLTTENGGGILFYAVWKPHHYTIVFNGNNEDSGNMLPVEVSYSQSYTLSANAFVKDGHTFEGWAPSPDGERKYLDGATVQGLSADDGDTVTLYAIWEPYRYQLSFNGNGADSGSSDIVSLTFDEEYTLPGEVFTRAGYDFLGWGLSPGGSTDYAPSDPVKGLSNTPDGEVILYAIWKPHQYSVEFYGGSKATGSMEPQSFSYGTSAPLTANAYVRQGYSFKGWTSDSSGTGTVMYSDGKSVKDLTEVDNGVVKLYAIWEAQKVDYTVEHFLQDASGTYPTVPTYTEVKQAKADTTVKPPVRNVSSSQYKKPSVASLSVKPDGSSKLIYKYPRKSYTLTVKTGDNTKKVYIDGTSSQTSVTKTIRYGASVTINADPVPSQESELTGPVTYIFEKWTSPRGTSYSQEYTFTMPAANVTYTASCTEEDLYTYVEKTMSDGQVINGTTYHKFTSYSGNPSDKSKADIENTNANSDYVQSRRKQGQAITQLPDVQKEGYRFLGWYTAASGGDKISKTQTLPNADTTYFAHWSPNKYDIVFEDGDEHTNGSIPGTIGNQPYDCSSDISIPGCTAKVRLGSVTFDLNKGEGTTTTPVRNSADKGYIYGSPVDSSAPDKELKAGTYHTYTTTLKWTTGADGTGWGHDSDTNNTLKNGYYRTGMSWGNNGNGSGKIKKFEGGSIKDTFTNVIQGNEMSDTEGEIYLFAQYSGCSTVTLPAAPSRNYYHFSGWNTEADGTGDWIGEDGKTGTLTGQKGENTYYAIWEPYKFTVNFDKNRPVKENYPGLYEGGNTDSETYNNQSSSNVEGSMGSQTFTYDVTSTLNANKYSLKGWHFKEWNTKPDGNGDSFTDGKSGNIAKMLTDKGLVSNDGDSITFYAIWEQNTYTVKYEKNKPGSTEVSGTMDPQTFVYDRPQKLKSNTYTCSYYHYQKWSTKADGKGTGYSDGTWIGKGSNLTTANNGTVTLYAQWKPYKFKLKFDKNKPGNASHDVSGSMSDQEITYDAVNTLNKNNYELTGWDFTSWKCNGISITNGQELKNLLKSDTDNDTFTLYAQWRQNTFTIKFNSNGGSGVGDMTVKYDTDFSLPGCSRDANYRFDGWSPNIGRNYTSVDGAVVWTTAQWYHIPTVNKGDSSSIVVKEYKGNDSSVEVTNTGFPLYGWTDSSRHGKITIEWHEINPHSYYVHVVNNNDSLDRHFEAAMRDTGGGWHYSGKIFVPHTYPNFRDLPVNWN